MTQRSGNAPDPGGAWQNKPPPVKASLAGRGSCGLPAGAQKAPAATANEGARTMNPDLQTFEVGVVFRPAASTRAAIAAAASRCSSGRTLV
jgi:hypothetical protein